MTNERQHRRSDLETFGDQDTFGCPHRYNKIVREGLDDQSDEARRGVAFHIIALIYIKLLAQHQCSMDADLAREAFVRGLRMYALPTTLVPDVTSLWHRHTAKFELDLEAYFAAEEQQQTRRFRFIPDLVLMYPRHLVMKDWKTYFKALTEAQARREFQPKFYLWQAMQIWPGFERYTFVFVFVRLGFEVTLTYTPEEIEAFAPEIEGIVQGVEQAEETNEWPAMPGSHCGICRLQCPIADNPQLLPVRLTSREAAKAACGEILVLEQRLRKLRKAAAGYCSIEGPVEVGGQIFQHAAYPMSRYPAETALNICTAAGYDMSASSLSRGGLGFKQFPADVADALSEIEIRSRRAKFGHRKTGETDPFGHGDVLDPSDDDE